MSTKMNSAFVFLSFSCELPLSCLPQASLNSFSLSESKETGSERWQLRKETNVADVWILMGRTDVFADGISWGYISSARTSQRHNGHQRQTGNIFWSCFKEI